MRLSDAPVEERPIKLMLMGHSGSGKTGALAALANAGYRLFILDFDSGTPILRSYVTPEAAKNVFIKTFTDKLRMDGLQILPAEPPRSYVDAMMALNDWKEGQESLGTITKWGTKDILVVDSLTFFSRAAMRHILFDKTAGDLMGKGKESTTARQRWMHPWPQDYGEAQNLVENFFALTYGKHVNCNMVVCAHIQYIGGGGKQAVKDRDSGEVYIREVDSESEGIGYAVTIGKKLSPFINRYFNTVVLLETEGSGQSAKRVLHTVSQERIPLKNELPVKLPARIPIDGGKPDTGLAKMFSILRAG